MIDITKFQDMKTNEGDYLIEITDDGEARVTEESLISQLENPSSGYWIEKKEQFIQEGRLSE